MCVYIRITATTAKSERETANENKVEKQINNPKPGMVIITIAFNCEGNSRKMVVM